MTDELKPCPFFVHSDVVLPTAKLGKCIETGLWYVRCNICEGTGPLAINETEAAEAWNTRAPVEDEEQR